MSLSSDMRHKGGNRLRGLEIFDITPVMLGGDPDDPDNKTALTRRQHIEAVRYWNRIIKKMKSDARGE